MFPFKPKKQTNIFQKGPKTDLVQNNMTNMSTSSLQCLAKAIDLGLKFLKGILF